MKYPAYTLLTTITMLCFSSLVVGQSSDPAPQIIKEYNDKIYQVFLETKDSHRNAMIEFRNAIEQEEDTKADYAGSIIDVIMEETLSFVESKIPFSDLAESSYELAMKTIFTVFEESKNNVRKGGNLSAKQWIQKEIDDLDQRFRFLHYHTLLDSLVNAYSTIEYQSEREDFINGLELFHQSLVQHLPEDDRSYEIKIYENWINSNFNEEGEYTQGALYSKIKIDDYYGASRHEFGVRAPYGPQIGQRLNSLLEQKGWDPMDLQVHKLLVVYGLQITNCSTCSQVIMLGSFNDRLWWPTETDFRLSERLERFITKDLAGSKANWLMRDEYFGGSFN